MSDYTPPTQLGSVPEIIKTLSRVNAIHFLESPTGQEFLRSEGREPFSIGGVYRYNETGAFKTLVDLVDGRSDCKQFGKLVVYLSNGSPGEVHVRSFEAFFTKEPHKFSLVTKADARSDLAPNPNVWVSKPDVVQVLRSLGCHSVRGSDSTPGWEMIEECKDVFGTKTGEVLLVLRGYRKADLASLVNKLSDHFILHSQDTKGPGQWQCRVRPKL